MKKKKIPKKKKKIAKEKSISTLKNRQLINVGLTALLVIVIVGAVMFLSDNQQVVDDGPDDMQEPPAGEAVAVVNQEEITQQELDERYGLLPAQYQQFVTKEQILAQMIDEKLLLQAAQQEGITATDAEVDELVDNVLQQNNVTREEFETALQQRGLTLSDVENIYRRDLILNKFLNQTLQSADITDTDIKDYYFKNLEQYTIPEARNISHILICHNESLRCVSNLTKEEALAQADEVQDQLTVENFAEMAMEHSDEPAAQQTAGNLGWVSREDPFDATFLNASFSLNVSEISEPVETDFGYHIILVYDARAEEEIPIEEVYDDINQTLQQEQQSQYYQEYLQSLKSEAEIINFLEQEG